MAKAYMASQDDLIVDFGEELAVVTTAHPRGLVKSRHVVIHRVNDDPERPEEIKESVRRSLGLPEDVPVMLTAVDVGRHRILEGKLVGLATTVGLAHPSCPGMSPSYKPFRASTINLVVWTYEHLTVSAMLDLLRTVSEAKAAAAADLGLRCSGRATGTVSDALVVAARADERGYLWAGPATTIGSEASRLTYEAVKSFAPPPEERLKDLVGLSLEDLVADGVTLYSSAPVPGVPGEATVPALREELERLLRDPNVWALVYAARELDLIGASGLLPGLGADEFAADSKKVIADELLATALSLYINGFRALTATYWADTLKERLGLRLSALPMFEDDIAAALVASALSRVYDRLLGS